MKETTMKKTFLILSLAFVCMAGISRADSNLHWVSARNPIGNLERSQPLQAIPLYLTVAATPDGNPAGSTLGSGFNAANGAGFAQINNGARPLPLLSMWFFPLLALTVLALRIFGVHRARVLADQEHRTHHARRQVYRMLQQRD